jgi:hypothetical protein
MLDSCVKAVFWLRKSVLINFELPTKSTAFKKYLTSQVFLCTTLFTNFKHITNSFTQAFPSVDGHLSSFFTGSINTNKLIKDF